MGGENEGVTERLGALAGIRIISTTCSRRHTPCRAGNTCVSLSPTAQRLLRGGGSLTLLPRLRDINGVPFPMILATHFYFSFYHTLSNMALRKVYCARPRTHHLRHSAGGEHARARGSFVEMPSQIGPRGGASLSSSSLPHPHPRRSRHLIRKLTWPASTRVPAPLTTRVQRVATLSLFSQAHSRARHGLPPRRCAHVTRRARCGFCSSARSYAPCRT